MAERDTARSQLKQTDAALQQTASDLEEVQESKFELKKENERISEERNTAKQQVKELQVG